MLEPSKGMYDVASEVLCSAGVSLVNTSIEDYSSPDIFNLIISHMCIQTVEHLEPFLQACSRLMHDNAFLLLSLPHPAFYNSYKHFFDDETFSYMEERSAI